MPMTATTPNTEPTSSDATCQGEAATGEIATPSPTGASTASEIIR